MSSDPASSDNLARYIIVQPPAPNFALAFEDGDIQFEFTVKKTLRARVKYWLFCKFFPFKVERWD